MSTCHSSPYGEASRVWRRGPAPMRGAAVSLGERHGGGVTRLKRRGSSALGGAGTSPQRDSG